MYCMYVRLCIVYKCIITARTGVLPVEVCFDCTGPVFYALWDGGGLPKWLTRFVSKT